MKLMELMSLLLGHTSRLLTTPSRSRSLSHTSPTLFPVNVKMDESTVHSACNKLFLEHGITFAIPLYSIEFHAIILCNPVYHQL